MGFNNEVSKHPTKREQLELTRKLSNLSRGALSNGELPVSSVERTPFELSRKTSTLSPGLSSNGEFPASPVSRAPFELARKTSLLSRGASSNGEAPVSSRMTFEVPRKVSFSSRGTRLPAESPTSLESFESSESSRRMSISFLGPRSNSSATLQRIAGELKSSEVMQQRKSATLLRAHKSYAFEPDILAWLEEKGYCQSRDMAIEVLRKLLKEKFLVQIGESSPKRYRVSESSLRLYRRSSTAPQPRHATASMRSGLISPGSQDIAADRDNHTSDHQRNATSGGLEFRSSSYLKGIISPQIVDPLRKRKEVSENTRENRSTFSVQDHLTAIKNLSVNSFEWNSSDSLPSSKLSFREEALLLMYRPENGAILDMKSIPLEASGANKKNYGKDHEAASLKSLIDEELYDFEEDDFTEIPEEAVSRYQSCESSAPASAGLI